MSVTKITGTGLGLPTADGNALGGVSNEWSDFYLADGGIIYFGNSQEITLTHTADDGLVLKHVGTGDGKEPSLTFQAGDNDIAAADVLGSIFFQAPDENTGSDAILVAAGIEAVAEGDFSAISNATSLYFKTGASEAATTKMTLSSAGALDVTGDVTGSTLNADGDTAASDAAAMGYTAAEGLILTGQGSTNDVTIKNDADADVITIATGGTAVDVVGALTAGSVASDAGVSGTTGTFSAGVSGTTGTFTGTVDLNGNELILDANANTSIHASIDDQIDIAIAGADDFRFTANNFNILSGSTLTIDSGATITNSGTASGFADFTAIPDGSVSAPSLANSGDTNTGIYFPAADQVGVTVGGTAKFVFGQNPIYPRNMIDNGAMQVAQREGMTAGLTGVAFGPDNTINCLIDRFGATWYDSGSENAVATVSRDSDVPAGGGFGNSLKIDVTTANSSGAGYHNIRQRIEGQNLQHLEYGTANAKTCTFSFWFKGTVTGIHSVYFYHIDATQTYVREFTVASSNTWEFFQMTLPGYTTTAFDDDASASLEIGITLASNAVQASSNNVWQSGGDSGGSANQVNALSSTSNNIYTTGWQFEVGEVATDFAHESYAVELAKCQRHFYRIDIIGGPRFAGGGYDATNMISGHQSHPVEMRASPTFGKEDDKYRTAHDGAVHDSSITLGAALDKWQWYILGASISVTQGEWYWIFDNGGTAANAPLTFTAEM
jgi:hypothetical protein